MNRIGCLKLFVIVFGMLVAAQATAQASRTWVSGVGDDANPCSRTAPCKTFAGAISKTAVGGEIDALDPAGFGAVTITKGITIDGGGGQVASVLVSGTNGIVVQAGPSDVVILRNLRINCIGSGINGIRFLSGKQLVVDHCDIFGFTTFGIDASMGASATVSIANTTLTNNTAGAVRLITSGGGLVSSMRNLVIRASQNGIVVGGGAGSVSATVSGSTISFGGIGLLAQSSSSISADTNTINGNSVAVQAQIGGLVRLSNNSMYDNGTGIFLNGGTVASAGDNRTANGTPGAPNASVTIQ